uniref:CSON005429 protein n=1 Tax=Culicoides sonorensis TaxID=179676 RepID=A0A336MQG5_CULSO
MVDINRRVQSLMYLTSDVSLSPRSSLSGETPPASPMNKGDPMNEPMYENTQNLEILTQELNDLRELNMKHMALGPPLSPIYEKPTTLDIPQAILSRSSSSSNTRSVSAAVSDESVAGDSGVFEASRALLQNKDTAQVQIGLKYSKKDSCLTVTIERARNLSALYLPVGCQLYIRAALVPGNSQQTIRTSAFIDFVKPSFNSSFSVIVPLQHIYSKSLQVKVMSITNNVEEWVGNVQISLAEFNDEDNHSKWYNVISMSNPETMCSTFKEESSDESTIISSQTSTLTRDQNHVDLEAALNMQGQLNINSDDEDDDQEDDSDKVYRELSFDQVERGDNFIYSMFNETIDTEVVDKETNTECAFLPEKRRTRELGNSSKETTEERIVKRSQTFSPSAVVPKNRYVCRLNRSDSDSAMHFNNQLTPHSFRRGAIERRSLRYNNRLLRPPTNASAKSYPAIPRTSLDLELDLKAQQTKLLNLNDEIVRLRELKQRLEQARDNNDTKIATWALENEQLQKIVDAVQSQTNPETKHMQKLLHKTSKEIYKLRKTKACKGQPDVTSFKEKMAFFTRQGLSVPEIPIETTSTEELITIENNNIKCNNTHFPLSLKNSTASDISVDDLRGVEV